MATRISCASKSALFRNTTSFGRDNRQVLLYSQFNRHMQVGFFVQTPRADQLQIKAIGKMLLVNAVRLRPSPDYLSAGIYRYPPSVHRIAKITPPACSTNRCAFAARGFAIVSAIFLLVALAALAGFMVMFANRQQLTSAQDIQGSRAYWAAKGGVQWAAATIVATNACPAGNRHSATALRLS